MNLFPRMALVEQQFPRPQVESVERTIDEQFRQSGLKPQNLQGKNIAVAGGSRGIANIAGIVKTVVEVLKHYGAKPFILPAMGSHGGGTAEGQAKILADYGITPETMGVPIRSSMETVRLVETNLHIPVFMDRFAYEADGVIVVNRIKPHTDFHGEVESGLMKMITIGLGKKDGADACHSRTSMFAYDQIILSVSRHVLETGKILAGVAILENAYHETAELHVIPAPDIENRERELLSQAKSWMPSLPVEKADALIIDRIGKDISGTGLDPNITGRWYGLNYRIQETPDILRIVVLDLTEESKGNAVGIGLADFTSRRVIDKMNKEITYLNAITSRNILNAFLPLTFESDREALEQCMISLGKMITPQTVRLLHIRDTLNVTTIAASEALLPELKMSPQVKSIAELREIRFDEKGNFLSELNGV
ncbi:MAG: DUF2088 domain-containing protein [Candidatus Omnitrophota bacterium]|nr:MAG: DUF2088 domain-containing protein [Candidatus Omnitrophota bacterium]